MWCPSPSRPEDNATGRLLEGIIESVDEFYSENLAQDVVRGMREAASRGFFLASNAPFGYRRVKVSDGVKECPTLEVDPATAPVVRETALREIPSRLNSYITGGVASRMAAMGGCPAPQVECIAQTSGLRP